MLDRRHLSSCPRICPKVSLSFCKNHFAHHLSQPLSHDSALWGFWFQSPLFQGRLNLPLQIRQVMLDNVPDLVGIYAEVIVDHHIPKSRDPVPVHAWDARFQGIRQIAGGFSEGLQVAKDRILGFGIGEEGLLAFLGIGFNPLDTFGNMDEVDILVFHRGTASWSTLSRIY